MKPSAPSRYVVRFASVARHVGWVIAWLLANVVWTTTTLAQDTIEFLSGTSATGRVVEIRKDRREIDFELQIAGQQATRTYPYAQVHAVNYRGKRYILTPLPNSPDEARDATGDAPRDAGRGTTQRSREDLLRLITTQGNSPPELFGETKLDYPATLDLAWPEPAPGPWDNQRNVGQYIWDVINPNPHKWRSGIVLMHHLLTESQQDDARSRRIMASLGSMYFRFFQDYPRAAFWFRKAKVNPPSIDGVALAECYWRLGNKPMALQQVSTKTIRVEAIKLLGDMGDKDRAVQMARQFAQRSKQPHWALLAAADACRAAGDFPQAIDLYQQVLAAGPLRNAEYDRRAQSRAEQSIEAIRLFQLLDIPRVPSGTYVASSLGYEGPVEVTVTVDAGRITQLEVSRHQEKQFYSALRDMPQQIIAKQSVANVDATSRATITAEAIVSATAKALDQATPQPTDQP